MLRFWEVALEFSVGWELTLRSGKQNLLEYKVSIDKVKIMKDIKKAFKFLNEYYFLVLFFHSVKDLIKFRSG